MKKLTKKEMDLKQNPWLTTGILKSIKARDDIHKKFLNAKNPLRRQKRVLNKKKPQHDSYSFLVNHSTIKISSLSTQIMRKKHGRAIGTLLKFLLKIVHYQLKCGMV